MDLPKARVKTHMRTTLSELLFYAVILSLPFEEWKSIGGMTISKCLGLLFFLFSPGDWRIFYGRTPALFIAFGLFIGIGLVVDLSYLSYGSSMLNFSMRPLLLCVLMVVSYNLAVHGRLKRVVMAVYLSSLLYAIVQSFLFHGARTRIDTELVDGELLERSAVLGADENFAACYLALCIPPGLIYGFNLIPTRWMYRVFALAGSAIGFYAMLKTSSRGGMLAVAVGVLCIVLTATHMAKKVKYAVFVAGIMGIMAMAVMNNPLLQHRISSSLQTRETAGRTEIWSRAARLYLESPFYGFGSFMHMRKLGEATGHSMCATHNLFLSVLLSTGILGFSLFMYFYWRSFQAVWRRRTEGECSIVFAWFMTALVAGLSINVETTKWFWIVVALSLATRGQPRQAEAGRKVWLSGGPGDLSGQRSQAMARGQNLGWQEGAKL
jgi:O-antigen ligase